MSLQSQEQARQMQVVERVVTTVPEVVRRWGKTRKSVMMQIYKGGITAVQHGATWIVFVPSVVALWGSEIESEDK